MSLKWNTQNPLAPQGVLTGCEESEEWMLKWWWNHYSKHNTLPVTFVDFGMSLSARKWCETKGHVITVKPESLSEAKEAPWVGKVSTHKRNVWLSKPIACMNSPYENTLWIDIDCEVQKNLSPIFSFAEVPDGFAISYDAPKNEKLLKDCSILKKDVKGIQGGVFAYKRHSPVVQKWAEYCLAQNALEHSDQSALSHLLHEKNFNISHFSEKYNWLQTEMKNPDASIIHHTGNHSKLMSKLSFS